VIEGTSERQRTAVFEVHSERGPGGFTRSFYIARESEQRTVELVAAVASAVASVIGVKLYLSWQGEWK
jgi:hypothetical protein